MQSNRRKTSLLAASIILASACGAAVTEDNKGSQIASEADEVASIASAVSGPVPRPPLPIRTVFDFAGNPRVLAVRDSNASNTSCYDRLEYTLQLSSGAPRKLVVSEGLLGMSLSLLEPTSGTELASILVTRGRGAELRSAGASCPSSALGPFVIDHAAPCLRDLDLYILLDVQTLVYLEAPTRLNGVAVGADGAQQAIVNRIFDKLVTRNQILLDSFRFRSQLNSMSPAERDALNKALADYVGSPGSATAPAGHHEHIDHLHALADDNEDYLDRGHHAAFLDGHRAFLREFEAYLRSKPGLSGRGAFRRLPAWNPELPIPGPLDDPALVLQRDPRRPLPTALQGGTICTTYGTATRTRIDAARLLADADSPLRVDASGLGPNFNGWHGGVHVAVGGAFADLSRAAFVPLFYPWHTTVDTVWSSLQQCYVPVAGLGRCFIRRP